ncbi:UNVERIFIED_CONTAM: hypothetical protein Scaly_1191900 [Sesamum calycinum]|uniref:Reverse transcriptase domain-containing protein n=1 Tax=Sesamum calycinum TaxID=2727403 RepID=A0AAW2Q3Q9_9LAMI
MHQHHFANIFKTTNLTKSAIDVVLESMESKVGEEENTVLVHSFSPKESASVANCLIMDNVLIGYEINHHLSQKRWGTVGSVALIFDISKAYNQVEWIFLERVVHRLGDELFSSPG